ncbi:MAG TPA: ABATE domain-containing protein [Ktedonobacterales bacterium]|jgi:predicted RNA-binding Zn ribbon-like protein|nr:ABATE domain-containing protein [Ktedonobacterales bacterium]
MTNAEIHFGPLSRVGGADCLDFVNTLHWRGTDEQIERLAEYDDLVAWAAYGNLLDESQAARLRTLSQKETAEAGCVLQRAWTLREALHRIIRAEMERRVPAAGDLSLLNEELGAALAHTQLTWDAGEYHLGWHDVDTRLDAPLWPAIRSAADLLRSPLRKKIRQCSNTPCNWIFIDESKNSSRRWCSMAICGTQVKMRNYYRRKHGQSASVAGA